MATITKHVESWEWEKLANMPNAHRLPDLTYSSGMISYTFVEGEHCVSWRTANSAAVWFWHEFEPTNKIVSDANRQAYYNYCWDRCQSHEHKKKLMWLRPLLCEHNDLTPVQMTHGDYTFSNIIVTHEGEVYPIDPGHDRGLTCREIDESKMLQSLDGWHKMKHGKDLPNIVFPTRRIHWVLLATHYLRILRHEEKHEDAQLGFAERRFEELCALWK